MINNLNITSFKKNWLFYALVSLLALLPFQFALNPTPGVDLAITRVIIITVFIIFVLSNFNFKSFFIEKNLLTNLVLLFLFIASFSVFFSQNILWSLRKLAFLFSIFPVYYISLKVFKSDFNKKTTIKAFVIGATLIAILSLVQFFSQFIFGINTVYDILAKYVSPFFLGNSFSKTVLTYPSWLVADQSVTYMRAVGTFPDPHMLSYYLGLALPWSVSLSTESPRKTNLYWIASLLILLADIATFTRGGYIALIASSIIIMPLVNRKNLKKLILVIILVAFLFTISPHGPVTNRLNSSFDIEEGSNKARLSNWEQALIIIKDNPLGVGIGMYSLTVDSEADYRKPIYAHNLYLDIFAELGFVALFILVGILIKSFINFWKYSKKNPFYVAGVFSITLFSVHSLVESPLYSVHVLTIFLVIVALASRLEKNEDISD